MRKRIVVLLFALVAVSLAGCGKENTKVTANQEQVIETDAEVKETFDAVAGIVETEELDWESAEEDNSLEDEVDNSVITEAEVAEKQGKTETPAEKDSIVDAQESKKENSEKNPTVEKENVTTDTSTTTDKVEETAKQESSEQGNSTQTEEGISYEEFLNLSAAEQQKYMETFANIESFFVWYNQAKSEYEKEHPPIILDGDKNNVEDFLGGE